MTPRHYQVEIRKRSFVSTASPTIHTNPPRDGASKTLFTPEESYNFSAVLLLVQISTAHCDRSVKKAGKF